MKYYLFAALLLAANISFAQESYRINSLRRDFKFKINSSLPEFTFCFFFRFDESHNPIGISRIEIRRGNETHLVQTIRMEKPHGPYDYYRNYRFGAKDMNFDGSLDLLLEQGNGGSGGDTYEVWLYDSKAGRFKSDPQFEGMFNPVPDPKSKTIISSSWGGVWSKEESVYRFEEGKLVLIHDEVQEYTESREYIIRTVRDYNHKKITSILVDTLKAEEK